MDRLLADLKIKVIEVLNFGDLSPDDIKEDEQFAGGALGIDSIDILELAILIEKDYQVTFNDRGADERQKIFATLRAIAAYIMEKSPVLNPA